MNTTVTAMLN